MTLLPLRMSDRYIVNKAVTEFTTKQRVKIADLAGLNKQLNDDLSVLESMIDELLNAW